MTQDARPFREYLVGHKYRVPCIRATWLGIGPCWWPVNGPRHEDSEHLDFDEQHWHIDQRFITRAVWDGMHSRISGFRNVYGVPLMLFSIAPRGHNSVNKEVNGEQPEECYLKYLNGLPRETWFKRLRRVYLREYEFEPMMENLRKKLRPGFEGTRLNLDRRICPHKGADLSRIPDQDGVIECPLHGLRFCTHTGETIWGTP